MRNACPFRDEELHAVVPSSKAIAIEPFHNRRKTDVLVAIQHRNYRYYVSTTDNVYTHGIAFYKADGSHVVNYPIQHRDNLTSKNQETNSWFIHIVRVFKNARQVLIDQQIIGAGIAPSYYLEGLLYNAPIDCFGDTYEDSVVECVNWLYAADRSRFLCANQQYPLLDGTKCDMERRGLHRVSRTASWHFGRDGENRQTV